MRVKNLLLLAGAWLMLSGYAFAAEDSEAAADSTAAAASSKADQPTRAERRAAKREAKRQAQAEQVAEVAAEPGSESGDDLVCRRESVVGSHFRVRRCYTRAELEQSREESQELLRESRASRASAATPQ